MIRLSSSSSAYQRFRTMTEEHHKKLAAKYPNHSPIKLVRTKRDITKPIKRSHSPRTLMTKLKIDNIGNFYYDRLFKMNQMRSQIVRSNTVTQSRLHTNRRHVNHRPEINRRTPMLVNHANEHLERRSIKCTSHRSTLAFANNRRQLSQYKIVHLTNIRQFDYQLLKISKHVTTTHNRHRRASRNRDERTRISPCISILHNRNRTHVQSAMGDKRERTS